ncbi:MAG: VOC family protein, partial [Acidimicrobiales bacterium]
VINKIVIDVAGDDHGRELVFWEEAVGQPLPQQERFPEYHGANLPGLGIGLLVQRLQAGESRVHIDIHADDVEAEVARLERLGAQLVEQRTYWSVMRDPAGLLFCVVIDHNLDDTNSHVWEP